VIFSYDALVGLVVDVVALALVSLTGIDEVLLSLRLEYLPDP
jgi:hypothetical protein